MGRLRAQAAGRMMAGVPIPIVVPLRWGGGAALPRVDAAAAAGAGE